ncbi:hypothetical protein [Streptomyces sp. H27-S2]|uniref:hypothetical protein n=1 Tax=Streptomyces antarcticus TaxID=2996458 RepID=UPI00226D6FF1|nr:hypothetical protein [Streptomyces sp. H27-S2]MCY0951433.1 hypothetical protein [Streptomyces sp. H27-S2]
MAVEPGMAGTSVVSALTLLVLLVLVLVLVSVLFLSALGYLACRHPRTVPAMGATLAGAALLVACIATITAR